MRERLIELIAVARNEYHDYSNALRRSGIPVYESIDEYVASYLLTNGAIVPPCKVGDKTFLLLEKISGGGYDIVESQCVYIAENQYAKIYAMAFDCPEIGNTLEYRFADFGKTVFLTREEAEQALKGGVRE